MKYMLEDWLERNPHTKKASHCENERTVGGTFKEKRTSANMRSIWVARDPFIPLVEEDALIDAKGVATFREKGIYYRIKTGEWFDNKADAAEALEEMIITEIDRNRKSIKSAESSIKVLSGLLNINSDFMIS